MKKIALLFTLLLSLLSAENNITIEKIWLLKTDLNLSVEELNHSSLFTPILKDEKFNNKKIHYWLKIYPFVNKIKHIV